MRAVVCVHAWPDEPHLVPRPPRGLTMRRTARVRPGAPGGILFSVSSSARVDRERAGWGRTQG